MIDDEYLIDIICNLSESTIYFVGDEQFISLYEDAHSRRVGMAKGYKFDHINKDEKIKRGMLLSKEDMTDGKSKRTLNRNDKRNKNGPTFLGSFSNSYDANETGKKAATFRQNLNVEKQNRRLFKNPKMDKNKVPESKEELRQKTEYSPDTYAASNMHRNTWHMTKNAINAENKNEVKAASMHELNHLQDYKDMKKLHGHKIAERFADAARMASHNLSKAGKHKDEVYEKTKDDPYSFKNYRERQKADAKYDKASHSYMANPSEYNSKAIGAAIRKGVLHKEDPNKIRAFRLRTLNRFAKNKGNVFFNWDKHYS